MGDFIGFNGLDPAIVYRESLANGDNALRREKLFVIVSIYIIMVLLSIFRVGYDIIKFKGPVRIFVNSKKRRRKNSHESIDCR